MTTKPRRRRIQSRLVRLLTISMVIGSVVAGALPVPPAVASDGDVDAFDPEVVDPEAAPLPEVITDAERDAPVVTPPEEIEWSYGEPEVPDSPEELIDEGTLLPKEGGEMVDVYAVETADESSEHAAIVYSDVVNRETATGKWVDLVLPELEETPDAYVAKANAITTTFPKEMAADSRIVYRTQGGELRMVLSGIDSSEGSSETEEVATEPNPAPSTLAEDPSPSPADEAGSEEPSPSQEPAPVSEEAPAAPTTPTGDPTRVKGEQTSERTVIYRNIRLATDAQYVVNDQGYKENITLQSPKADPNLAWDMHAEGFTLRMAEEGSILITDASGEDVAGFAVPMIRDSSPETKVTYGSYQLTPLQDGNYTLGVVIDPTWLAGATYPVIVDPGPATATKYPSRDTSVSSGNNTNYENTDSLWVSEKQGDKRRTFIKQDLSPLTNHGRIVYGATLTIVPYSIGNCTPYNNITAHRVLAPSGWPSPPMTWNNQPDIDQGAGAYAVNGGPGDPDDNQNGNVFGKFELEDIYQHYIDLDQPFHWSPQGIRLSGGPNNVQCRLASSEVGGGAQPTLLLSYNDLPERPEYSAESIGNNETIDTISPALKVSNAKADRPSDPNDDDVMFQYQVSENAECAAEPDGIDSDADGIKCKWGEDPDTGYTSPPTEAHTWSVPSGVLTDGGTFWWRAISVDVCGHDGGIQLCGNKGGAQHEVPYKGTDVRKFKVVTPKLGTDPKWKQWTQSIGSGLVANVNETTGNLNLDASLETLSSPLGPLGIGLTYNSQSTEYTGIGAGWDLAIGELGKGNELPLRLKQLGVNKGSSIVVTFRGGEKRTYSKRDDARLWGGAGSDAGWISAASESQNGKPHYTYRFGDGSYYTFDSKGNLLQARPRGTVADTDEKYYFDYTHQTYTWGAQGQFSETVLKTVEDPRDKQVNLTWIDRTEGTTTHKVLDKIVTWNTDDGAGAGNEYKFHYTGGFKLAAIELPTARDGQTDMIEFAYNSSSGKICAVANALQRLATSGSCSRQSEGPEPGYKSSDPQVTTPWTFEMNQLQEKIGPNVTITGPYRVTKATPPTVGSIQAKPWLFNYMGNGGGNKDFYGAAESESTVAEVAYVCDPNSGFTSFTQCAPSGGNLPNNGTQLDFNMAGLPLRIYGPTFAQGGNEASSYAATTTMLWDANNQLVCSRSPQANAYQLMTPLTIEGASDCRENTRNTAYEYQERAPYNETKVTFPDPGDQTGADTGKRRFEKTTYDEVDDPEGDDFEALWVEGFRSEDMRGLPGLEKTSHRPDGPSNVTFSESWSGDGPDGFAEASKRRSKNGDDMQDNGWAIQWTGYLDLRTKPDGRKYAFKVPNDQPVSVSVGQRTLFDCAGGDRSDPNKSFNCGGPNEPGEHASIVLKNELVPISVIYTHANGTGTPGIDLKWDQNFDPQNPSYSTLEGGDLRTNLGIATRTEQGYQQPGGAEVITKTTNYSFDGTGGLSRNESKRRKIASQISVSTGGDTSVTTYDAFDEYGNPTSTTTSGSTSGGTSVSNPTVTGSYQDDQGNYEACQTKGRDAMEVANAGTGTVVDSVCDDAGNVTQVTAHVQAAPGQPAHDRITVTDYDRANRPIRVTAYKDSIGTQPLSDVMTTYRRDGTVRSAETLVATPDVWTKTFSFSTINAHGPLEISVTDSPGTDGVGPAPDWVGTATQLDWAGNAVFAYRPYAVVVDPANLSGVTTDISPPSGAKGTCSLYDELGRVTITRTDTSFDPGSLDCGSGGLATRTDYFMHNGTAADFRVVTTDPAGLSATTWLDMAGRKVKEQTEDRPATTYAYDEGGNAIEVVVDVPGGQPIRTSSTYDGFDRVTRTVNFSDGNPGNDLSNPGPNEEVTRHQYNSLGQLEWTDGPRPNDKISFTYDRAGRIETGQYDAVYLPLPDGTTSQGTPDATKAGATFFYDSAGERRKVDIPLTAGSGGTTMTRSWTYNALGQAASFTDGRGRSTSYAYTVAGQLVKTTMPDVDPNLPYEKNVPYDVIRAHYNKAGALTHQYAANAAETTYVGRRQCFAYDTFGNVKSSYVIDDGGAIAGDGQTCDPALAEADKTVSVDYDDLGRMTETQAGGWATEFGYDAAGRPASVIDDADGTAPATTTYDYYLEGEAEPEGALKSIDDPLVTTGQTTYTYDDAGRPESRTDPTGTTWSLAYEAATGRLDKQTIRSSANKIIAEFDPSFATGGNVATMTQTIVKDPTKVDPGESTANMRGASDAPDALNADSGVWSYAYDGASRLLSATQAGGPATNASFAYDYDGGGNRIKATAPRPDGTPATTTTNFDAAGLATTETRGALTRSYAYDVAGSLVSRQTTAGNRDAADKDYTYSYDAWGRMTSANLIENGATQGSTYATDVSYTLDALGRTMARTSESANPEVNDLSTTYNLVGTSELVASATTGSSSTSYAYGASGSPLAQAATGSGTAEFYLRNTHGDVVGTMSTASGAGIDGLTGTVAYSPFGERRSGTGAMDSDAEKQANKTVLGFQGQPTDAATGLVDANTRMYDPSIGRFTTIDSVFGDMLSPMSLNQYAYGNGNPITMSDPSGMSAMSQYRADMRQYKYDLIEWRKDVAARRAYLNITLPEYRLELQAWRDLEADVQVKVDEPAPPDPVPAPGPKPTLPEKPPVTVVSREKILAVKERILEVAREAAAVAAAKTRESARQAAEVRHAAFESEVQNAREEVAQWRAGIAADRAEAKRLAEESSPWHVANWGPALGDAVMNNLQFGLSGCYYVCVGIAATPAQVVDVVRGRIDLLDLAYIGGIGYGGAFTVNMGTPQGKGLGGVFCDPWCVGAYKNDGGWWSKENRTINGGVTVGTGIGWRKSGGPYCPIKDPLDCIHAIPFVP